MASANASASRQAGEGSYVLTHLDVYDWGAFGGRHSAEIDPQGTAIIGPTGSGKTTLVDALMTLLTANPRYNLASTGGHESDRDLVSYVRGQTGAGNNSGDNEHVARPGAVVTAIAARFSNGTTAVRIGVLLWIDGSSSAVADLKRRWVFCLGDAPDLDAWLEAHRSGGARALKQLENESQGLKFYEAKQGYLARLRNFFEVGDNAFTLLNRAAGLKQLNSIDEVFRELVLDDSSKFDRALEVADEFNTLDGIHAELLTARRQRDTLLPIDRDWRLRMTVQDELAEQRDVLALLPRWYAGHAQRLYVERGAALRLQVEVFAGNAAQFVQKVEAADARVQVLQVAYLQVGGALVEQLEKRCEDQREKIRRRTQPARDYRAWATGMRLDDALEGSRFALNQTHARERIAALQLIKDERKDSAQQLAAQRLLDAQATDALKAQLTAAQQAPGSNIPPEFGRFRAELAEHLAIDADALPFVAELIEVRPEEARWRGAIERAIGSHRLRLLCEPARIAAALAWVNQRNNRLHVRLREADAPSAPVQFLADGYTRKLTFKPHPLRESLKHLLSGIDLHCVDSAAQLRDLPHAMTEQGLMSGRKGYFDKQDQRRLDDDWMTGFDNRDRVASLQRQVEAAHATLRDSTDAAAVAQRAVDAMVAELTLLGRVLELQFDDIDVPGAERDLRALQDEIQRLTAPDSEAETARSQWQAEKQVLDRLRREELANATARTQHEEWLKQAINAGERAGKRAGARLDAGELALVKTALKPLAADELDQWQDVERQAEIALQQAMSKQNGKLQSLQQNLVRLMGLAKSADTGALTEVGTEIDDVPQYLQRLRVLIEEALPEKQQRFMAYLTQSSDQGVTQLLSDIQNEVATIEERIEDLNETLRRVDFQPGHYLRLVPQRVVHDSLKTLDQALRALRSAVLKDDQGESHYRALQHMVRLLREAVDRRKTLGARALLDPRHRLQFAVSSIRRDGDVVIETRTSSQGGSGGEKEIIASYVLTASLSYALCPDGSSRPLFATIVLDEAFSKSSAAVAGRIIRALEEFGLHPLFVTPNKEIRLLRLHTRSAILIHRTGQQATMTSLSWERLERHAQQRSQAADEVAG